MKVLTPQRRPLFAFLSILLIGVLAVSVPAHAQSPNTFTQQGLLTDDAGNPLNDAFNMTFRLGRAVDGGSIEYFYEESQTVQVTNGRYNAHIGLETGVPGNQWFPGSSWVPGNQWVPGSMWFPGLVYVSTVVGGETLEPPQPVSATPYAFLSSGLYNQSNLLMATRGNASLLLNNNSDGDPGQFAIFQGENETPVLRIVQNADGIAEVGINGNFFVEGVKDFRIQHPTKEDKVLHHHAVESNEVLNTYSGNVTLDENGEAVVEMPEWFEPINKDPRYHLTPVGGAAPRLHVAEPMHDGRFKIAGGEPGLRVSWRVTAVRDDPAARRYKVPTVQDQRDVQ